MLERITIYKDLAEIIRYHHARYDGKGYPRTSSADEIPMMSHIMIVADAFDAMTTNRIYRPRKSISEALDDLVSNSGTQFHPMVVDASMKALKDINLNETSQMPSSELENRRMAYFFQDSLTGAFNEDYLITILHSSNHPYRYLNVIDLKNFTHYNQMHSWEKGNLLLQEFAEVLKDTFNDSIIARYHGDDFIILSKNKPQVDLSLLIENTSLQNSTIEVIITQYQIDQYFDFEEFKEYH